ncbi:MAG TPA: PrgI family protein [Candidatus Dojkabacteria bacterium]|nr:PrgI family protein [Candidatus Dojkabacteria bacterium]
MKQHAIPQNVLDVEFKLFTKFTLKEFSYLAIGVGSGGLVLYLTVGGQIPELIGIPIFILSSIAGIFLALVPINDQPADKFIQNYIKAITSPTQRVWISKNDPGNRAKPSVKPTEEGKLISKESKEEKKKIIGAQPLPERTEEVESEIQKEVDKELEEIENTTPLTLNPSKLIITDENIGKYQFKPKDFENYPGNINLWICDKNYKPISGVIATLMDDSGNILYANRTGNNGYFLTNRKWKPGLYKITLESENFTLPTVDIILSGKETNLPIKISAL